MSAAVRVEVVRDVRHKDAWANPFVVRVDGRLVAEIEWVNGPPYLKVTRRRGT